MPARLAQRFSTETFNLCRVKIIIDRRLLTSDTTNQNSAWVDNHEQNRSGSPPTAGLPYLKNFRVSKIMPTGYGNLKGRRTFSYIEFWRF